MNTQNQFEYIGIPLDKGSGITGTQKGPQTLRDLGILERMQSLGLNIHDFGDINIDTEPSDISYNVKNLQTIINTVDVISETYDQLPANKIPIWVGGDHSIVLGTANATHKRYEDLIILYFDAHGDFNTEYSSPTHNAHGMPLAGLMGLLSSPLQSRVKKAIDPSRIFWIGTRALDKGEIDIAQKLHLNIYTAEQIHQEGMESVMKKIVSQLIQIDSRHIHMSFDIDGMDNLLAPATGVPEPNGLTENEFNLFCYALQDIPQQFTSIDFVEYNPLLDTDDFQTGKRCVNGLSQLIASVH